MTRASSSCHDTSAQQFKEALGDSGPNDTYVDDALLESGNGNARGVLLHKKKKTFNTIRYCTALHRGMTLQ